MRFTGCRILWNYNLFNFVIPVGKKGDCYDRYLVRLKEMRISLDIWNSVWIILIYLIHMVLWL
jgi:hypothetical protein